MSKFSKSSKKSVASVRTHEKTAVKNFMGGTSYTLNPLDTLRIVAASSIFGEPSYYRGSHDKPSNLSMLLKNDVLGLYGKDVESTTDVFTNVIDAALDHDFEATEGTLGGSCHTPFRPCFNGRCFQQHPVS